VPNSGKPEFGWGRAGEGGGAFGNTGASIARPPPPTPPHKGAIRNAGWQKYRVV